ncbi:hypothetical protein BC937DRAFT_93004 [Endogone sp. FLAS-F59071]|nr:hypothetical protein BC937DRAFT_93004 [Endogone sp. FLAS-F59071]|eukprot:RUS23049.1 hypothetical protein BC937DRAFT_93004 [Endogone sp. FLAS-F59071]
MDSLFSKQIHLSYTTHPDDHILATIQISRSESKKLLAIHVTDEQDPLLLFFTEINESDFRALQADQNLLVDFAQFPFNLIELFEECAQCQRDSSPKFLAQLSCDSDLSRNTALKIMETNRFKYITHLSLSLQRASDTEVKRNLANLVNGFKSEIYSLRTQLDTATTTLTARLKDADALNRSLNSDLSRLNDELARLRRELDRCSDARRGIGVQEREVKLEESLAMYKAQNTRLENALRQTKEEINKGNEIIQRLQSELRASRSKIKLKNVVTLQQEKLLDERGATLEAQATKLAELRTVVERTEEERDREKQRAEEAVRSRDEGQAVIEENARVIEWLHIQLNNAAAGISDFSPNQYLPKGLDEDYKPPTNTSRFRLDNVTNRAPPAAGGGTLAAYAAKLSPTALNSLLGNGGSAGRGGHVKRGAARHDEARYHPLQYASYCVRTSTPSSVIRTWEDFIRKPAHEEKSKTYGMLKLRAPPSVGGHNSPPIGPHHTDRRALAKDGLDGENHARLHDAFLRVLCRMRETRESIKRCAYASWKTHIIEW